jgi:hypothetical protein
LVFLTISLNFIEISINYGPEVDFPLPEAKLLQPEDKFLQPEDKFLQPEDKFLQPEDKLSTDRGQTLYRLRTNSLQTEDKPSLLGSYDGSNPLCGVIIVEIGGSVLCLCHDFFASGCSHRGKNQSITCI